MSNPYRKITAHKNALKEMKRLAEFPENSEDWTKIFEAIINKIYDYEDNYDKKNIEYIDE